MCSALYDEDIQTAYRQGCSLFSRAGGGHCIARASSLFLGITRRDPGHHQAMNMLGLCFDRQGNREKARDCFRRAIDLAPRGIYLLNLGISLATSGQWVASHEALERAAALEPLDPAVFFNLGQVCFALGRLEESIIWWRRTLELDPTYSGVHEQLALALLRAGRAAEAERILRHALSKFPDRDEIYVHLSSIYDALGWYARGAALWSNYLRRNPHRAPDLRRQAEKYRSSMAAKAQRKRTARQAGKKSAASVGVRGGGRVKKT